MSRPRSRSSFRSRFRSRFGYKYSSSGNKVFSINQNISPDSQKTFLVQQMFLVQNVFHHSDPAGLAKKQFGSKKHFSFKMVILAQNGSFLLIFGSFWAILAPFWAQKCFFGSKCFFRIKMFFRSNPAGLAKKHFEWKKTILNEKCFF